MVETFNSLSDREINRLINRYFRDRRDQREYKPEKMEDIILERDSALALIRELLSSREKDIKPTRYYGIIHPNELWGLDLSQYEKHNPNCINAVYTNLWTANRQPAQKTWYNLYILSPNYQYFPPYNRIVDCQQTGRH